MFWMIESLCPYMLETLTVKTCYAYVDAIVGYEDEDNDQVIQVNQVNTLVYARNGWRNKVWKSEKYIEFMLCVLFALNV